ncbi:MAG TPA: HNH endonuclease signature motif containing protein, partial [Mycobacteriales bacterium]|nr:HNH endonuclease signature motif containing protein [Mycobacteriales bacterium]
SSATAGVFPACDRPYQWCQAHHCVHWADGGRTDQNNGALVCGHHHRVIHHNGWDVRTANDGLPKLLPPRSADPERKPTRHHRHRKRTT